MYRDFDPKKYWESKPWCSVCGQRRVRTGTVCHQCLAMRKNNQEKPSLKAKISNPNEPEDTVNFEGEHRSKETTEFDVPGLAEAVERKVQQWKERLIDLSLRNRLVNFKQTRSSTLKILEPGISAIFNQLVKEEGEYYVYVQEEQGSLTWKTQKSLLKILRSQPLMQKTRMNSFAKGPRTI